MAADDILKQPLIARHLSILYKEVRELKRDKFLKDREENLGGSERANNNDFVNEARFFFEPVIVTSLIDDFNFLATRTLPTSLDSPGWVTDPEFSSKFLTVTKAPNISLPAVNDIVSAFFTGTYGTSPDIPRARYGLFGAAAGGVTQQLILKEQFGDFLRCRTFVTSGSSEGTTDIFVAKPFKFRQTPFDAKTVSGITYAYSINFSRSAVAGSVSRVQQVVPVYTVDLDLIYATEINVGTDVTTTGSLVTLLDMNADGRGWVTT